MQKKTKSQTLLEYVFFIVVFCAAILAMFNFLRVRIQGRLKSNAEQIGGGKQFESSRTTTTVTLENTP